MDAAAHIDELRREGELLAAAAARTPPTTAVPTCPGWSVADLLAHLGATHRWATGVVRDGATTPRQPAAAPGGLTGAALLEWYREGLAALVRTLDAAPADLACWTFIAAPSPRAFWARRQAHETAIHRLDVELTTGPVTPFRTALAADGIDELLTGFLTRPGRGVRLTEPGVLAVAAADVGAAWTVRAGPGDTQVTQGVSPDAGCVLRGPAAALYPLLWNRAEPAGVEVLGDAGLLARWRAAARIV